MAMSGDSPNSKNWWRQATDAYESENGQLWGRQSESMCQFLAKRRLIVVECAIQNYFKFHVSKTRCDYVEKICD